MDTQILKNYLIEKKSILLNIKKGWVWKLYLKIIKEIRSNEINVISKRWGGKYKHLDCNDMDFQSEDFWDTELHLLLFRFYYKNDRLIIELMVNEEYKTHSLGIYLLTKFELGLEVEDSYLQYLEESLLESIQSSALKAYSEVLKTQEDKFITDWKQNYLEKLKNNAI